jgi:hypothetical protein
MRRPKLGAGADRTEQSYLYDGELQCAKGSGDPLRKWKFTGGGA